MSLVTIEHRSQKREDIGRPHRLQRKRSKGWQLRENTICVDDSTPWGNPFITGVHGTRMGCVRLYEILLSEGIVYSIDNLDQQITALSYVDCHIDELKGKNLACWCDEHGPCHADVLLKFVNGNNRYSR